MGSGNEQDGPLRDEIERIAGEAGAGKVAVACYDYETETGFRHRGDDWFHAASTIKLPVLVGVFAAIADGDPELDSRIHVRNRFFSAVDAAPYRIQPGRDANSTVHSFIGKTMKVRDLAHHMIVTSSNLATNLLVDVVGLERLQAVLERMGVEGVRLRRGVEDERAFEEGINNEVTASGLVQVLRLVGEEKAISKEASDRMLEILHQQEFRSGIPAGLPDDARVANKTGEISTVAHDTGLVYLPGNRKPYALAILSEWDPTQTSGRRDVLARISRAVHEHLAGAEVR